MFSSIVYRTKKRAENQTDQLANLIEDLKTNQNSKSNESYKNISFTDAQLNEAVSRLSIAAVAEQFGPRLYLQFFAANLNMYMLVAILFPFLAQKQLSAS